MKILKLPPSELPTKRPAHFPLLGQFLERNSPSIREEVVNNNKTHTLYIQNFLGTMTKRIFHSIKRKKTDVNNEKNYIFGEIRPG